MKNNLDPHTPKSSSLMVSLTKNKAVNAWVEEIIIMTNPDTVVWIDGSENQLDDLRAKCVADGVILPLNKEKLPGCYLHRSALNDVAQIEHRTYICSRNKEDAGPTNNWEEPASMYAKLRKIYKGSMKGRTMYVIPFSMSVPESPFAKFGIEITDSIYVVLNMAIMTRVGTHVLKYLDASKDPSDFTKGLHAKSNLEEKNRYIVQFPEDNTIWSINSEYVGNALLGKKCLGLRLASYFGHKEGWLAGHMAILGIETSSGEIHYVVAAFPSACGKTNLSMLIPPEVYKRKGYKVWCVGDDIAWLRVGSDGRLWAVNPEAGFLGVTPGTNMKSNPNAILTSQKNTIFTNVVHNLDDNTVWWEGMSENPPKNALNWKGEKWDASDGSNGTHPNSRFTTPACQCPCISSEFESLQGVPISAIIFGGRRAKTIPLVYQSRNWDHGVFVGATLGSETTAAAVGTVGVLRRDPMAMLQYCGYNMGDFFSHWFEMGKNISNLPKIFNVNWFRTDDAGNFLWPGYGENLRILDWIIRRSLGEVDVVETPIGYLPKFEDINLEGLENVSLDILKELLFVDRNLWREEAKRINEFYEIFGDKLPMKLKEELITLQKKLD